MENQLHQLELTGTERAKGEAVRIWDVESSDSLQFYPQHALED